MSDAERTPRHSHPFRTLTGIPSASGTSPVRSLSCNSCGTTSLFHGFRPHWPTRDSVRAPEVVILDEHLKVRWKYVGRRVGDYPPLGAVLDAIRRIDQTPGSA